jgi:hypothetical protein
MTWAELDWTILARLRERFLRGAADAEPYWRDENDLANYDFTYGERIGWKWDQVLRELRLRQWQPRSRSILDWGCGSGVAGRRVIRFFGEAHFDELVVWDHSPVASDFAGRAAREKFPRLRVTEATPGLLESGGHVGLLVLSHVINELTPAQRESLRILAARADEVLWVEPGSYDDSRKLGTMREQLRASGFNVIAPCTHQNECPMFALGNERHWCHFFAPPPAEIHADSDWVKFGHRAGIDLRSLPYSFIALSRADVPAGTDSLGCGRVIGRPEHFKPYARVLNCDITGLTDLEIPKRTAPALYKDLERTKAPLVYRWERLGNKITSGNRIGLDAMDS